MKYVILKKINNTWYATRNRYTAKELEIIIDKHYDDVVDFELINSGEYQGLDDGVIIVRDDGRELDKNGVYLNDDLIKEDTKNSNFGLYLVILFIVWLLLGVYGVMFVGLCWLCVVIYNTNKTEEDVQSKLSENHKARGMM